MSSALYHSALAEPHSSLPLLDRLRSPDARLLAYLAIAIGAVIRATHVFSSGFPLNDGGLFLRMTQDLQAAHYHIPAFTTYNNGSIPFGYPPLGFYLAGAINSVSGIPLLQLLRFIPLIASVLTVVAFYYLARTMLRDELAAAAAVLAFALVPRSYVWLLMGGGLTRAPGLLFAIIGLQQAYQMYNRREWRYAATTSVFCALTVLSHLGAANFLAFSIALLIVFYGRNRFGLVSSAAVLAGTLLLTAPWWAVVIAQHGLAPFQAARGSGSSIFTDATTRYEVLSQLARFNTGIGGEPLFPLVSVLALIGAFVSLRPALLILPVWWVLIAVLDAREGATYAQIPAALLAGIAITYVLVPGLRALYNGSARRPQSPFERGGSTDSTPAVEYSAQAARRLRFIPALVLGSLLLYGIASSLTRNPDFKGEAATITALTPADLDAMRWASRNIPEKGGFLVVTGKLWHRDKVAEWFPALANRASVSTVQGSEWLPGFAAVAKMNNAFQSRCSHAGAACLAAWGAALGRPFTHVYIPKAAADPCCNGLIAALRRDSTYVAIYDGPGAFIAARR